MKNLRSIADPPFRLKQESAGPRQAHGRRIGARQGVPLEAWPTGQGDYFLAGRDTFPIKDRIAAAGGRWDSRARKWFVSKEQAEQLGAAILVRVLRAPACCEKYTEAMTNGVEALATPAEVLAGRMVIRQCPYCETYGGFVAVIRDVLDLADVPELPAQPSGFKTEFRSDPISRLGLPPGPSAPDPDAKPPWEE